MAKLYTIALIIFLASAAPATAGAAEIYISPPLGSHYKGENFEVNLLVNSDVAINAVSVVLNFPTQNLKVLDVSKKNSDLNFWVEEPSFSNTGTLGNIRLEGVILNPGFTGTGGRIVSVTFQAVGEGRPSINVSQSAILANDGRGTNVNASQRGANFTILPAKVLPAPVQQPQKNAPDPQVIFVQPLLHAQPPSVLAFWEAVPKWVQTSILIFIGLATIVFSLIILSFGTLVLVWLWSHIWHRRLQFLAFLRLSADVFKNAARNTASFFGMAERELKSDVGYSIHRLTGELKEASYTLSFRDLVRRYLFSLSDIVKRSFTKNITVDPNTTEGLNKPERDLF